MKKNYFENLPGWSRGVISVVGIGAIVYISYSIYQSYKKTIDEKKILEGQKLSNIELYELNKKGIKPTKSNAQFEIWSAKIVEAIAGCQTDEEAIYTVFRQMTNKADVLKLISIFGIRYKVPCFADEPLQYSKWLWDKNSFPCDLSTFLQYDLDNSEIAKINNILKSKNIDFTF